MLIFNVDQSHPPNTRLIRSVMTIIMVIPKENKKMINKTAFFVLQYQQIFVVLIFLEQRLTLISILIQTLTLC